MHPTPFGRYLLTERLAAGGCAEIFKAKLIGIEGFEKAIAIKRILPHWSANQHFITMLIDEAKIMVRLNHEKIVQVYELGKEGETYYIAMEYVEGIDLKNLIQKTKNKEESLQTGEILFIIGEILRGLDYIHKQTDENGKNLEIVHRDISPQNILISKEGRIKIADFGIAHATSRSYETATGILKGKFSYMSPEQASGGRVGEQTDLFATGILLYELLTGKRLFSGNRDLEVLEKVRHFDPEEFFKNSKIDPPLKPILIRTLHPNLRKRYSTAQELLKELSEIQKNVEVKDPESQLASRLKSLEKSTCASKFLVTTEDLITVKETRKEGKKSFFRQKLLPFSGALLLLGILSSGLYLYLSPTQTFSTKAIFEGLQGGMEIDWENEESNEMKKIKEQSLLLPPGQGFLTVRAEPWGKVSINGIIDNSEYPATKSLKHRNYQISAAYQDLTGHWKRTSKNVKLSKRAITCTAFFSPRGEGRFSCR